MITVVRGRDEAAVRARLDAAFDSGDSELLKRFHRLAADHFEVIAGDIGEPNLGLDPATWDRLAHNVDQIIHPAALVNHVLPYSEEFGPNVVGTAEIIRLAGCPSISSPSRSSRRPRSRRTGTAHST